jgi:hypothetical protein
MTAPHAELDFKALLKLDPITLETVLRRRSAICASHSMAPHFPPFLFLKCLNEVTSQSNAETRWGEVYFELEEQQQEGEENDWPSESGLTTDGSRAHDDFSQRAASKLAFSSKLA